MNRSSQSSEKLIRLIWLKMSIFVNAEILISKPKEIKILIIRLTQCDREKISTNDSCVVA